MRSLILVFMFGAVIGIAYWAYQENVKTKKQLTYAQELQTALGETRNRLSILRAEWAYQNRPRRLQHLADMNYDSLHLLPLRADHFSSVDLVVFPDPPSLILSGLELVEIAKRVDSND